MLGHRRLTRSRLYRVLFVSRQFFVDLILRRLPTRTVDEQGQLHFSITI